MCLCNVQAKKGIQEAEASIGLLDVQSQLGLADRGPLPPRTLAEAALQVAKTALMHSQAAQSNFHSSSILLSSNVSRHVVLQSPA